MGWGNVWDDGAPGWAPTASIAATVLALLAGGVVGGIAVADGSVTGPARTGVVLGAAVLLGSLVAVPSLLR